MNLTPKDLTDRPTKAVVENALAEAQAQLASGNTAPEAVEVPPAEDDGQEPDEQQHQRDEDFNEDDVDEGVSELEAESQVDDKTLPKGANMDDEGKKDTKEKKKKKDKAKKDKKKKKDATSKKKKKKASMTDSDSSDGDEPATRVQATGKGKPKGKAKTVAKSRK